MKPKFHLIAITLVLTLFSCTNDDALIVKDTKQEIVSDLIQSMVDNYYFSTSPLVTRSAATAPVITSIARQTYQIVGDTVLY